MIGFDWISCKYNLASYHSPRSNVPIIIQCRLFLRLFDPFFFFFLRKKEPNRQPIIIYSDKSAGCRWKLFSRPVERNRSFREVSQFLSRVKIKGGGGKKAIVSNYIARDITREN